MEEYEDEEESDVEVLCRRFEETKLAKIHKSIMGYPLTIDIFIGYIFMVFVAFVVLHFTNF